MQETQNLILRILTNNDTINNNNNTNPTPICPSNEKQDQVSEANMSCFHLLLLGSLGTNIMQIYMLKRQIRLN